MFCPRALAAATAATALSGDCPGAPESQSCPWTWVEVVEAYTRAQLASLVEKQPSLAGGYMLEWILGSEFCQDGLFQGPHPDSYRKWSVLD